MTSQDTNDRSGKPRGRSARFILYGAILLALLLWVWLESGGYRHVPPAATEADLQRQREYAAKQQRVRDAFALVDKAVEAKDPAEKNRFYSEIIDTYRDDTTISITRCVSWALYHKAQNAADNSEKSRLLETVVDKYCDTTDEKVHSYVMWALRGLLPLAGDGAGKIAFCDGMLEKYDGRLPDSISSWLLSEKAESLRDRQQQIAVYDTMLARFLSSDDDGAFDLTIIAALDKMKLVADEAEQIRLCDIAIDAFLKTPDRTRYYLFERAADKKAELVGDPSLPLKLWNQVIENNVTEASVMQARSHRMPLLKDDAERLAACDETIALHQDSESEFVQLMVVRARMLKARLVADPEEKAALLRTVVEKSAHIDDTRAKDEANRAVEMLATLSGDKGSAARYYDQVAATSENRMEVLRALGSKAEQAADPAEKMRIYDEMLAKIGDSNETLELREAIYTIRRKIRLIDDLGEKIRLYDEIIAKGDGKFDHRLRESAAEAMLDKAALVEGREEKIRLYDKIIAKGMDGGDSTWLKSAVQAMVEKAKCVDDKNEKIKLYDTALFGTGEAAGRYFLSEPFQERLGLADTADEKLQLYDRYIAAAGGSISPDTKMSLLLDKAGIMDDANDKSRLYEEIIAFCERHLAGWKTSGGAPSLEDYGKRSLLDTLGKAVLGKAELTDNADEKIALYDRFLLIPQPGKAGFLNQSLEKILSKKTEVSGDPSIKNSYFDEKIRTATTDHERVNWYVQKARAAPWAERAAIEQEMLDKFFDSPEKEIQGSLAEALFNVMRSTGDAAERDKLCDRLIDRYGNSDDSRALYSVIRAFAAKADAAKDDAAKLELYNDAVERYKRNDDFLVKRALNDIIAAKFRLENREGQ